MIKSFFGNIFSLDSGSVKNRIRILDYIRGIITILVLYHHSAAPLYESVLQFHMPALFLLSGYTEFCLRKQTSFGAYLKARFMRLIVPYIFFELLNLVMFVMLQLLTRQPIGSAGSILTSILTATNNSYTGLYGRLWFLPAIFVASAFSYVIREMMAKKHKILLFSGVLLMIVLSFATTKLSFRLPFTIDAAFLGTAFILIGYGAGELFDWLLKQKHVAWDALIAVICAAVFVGCNLISNPKCFMYINYYEDYPFMLAVAMAGSLLVFLGAKWLMPLIEKIKCVHNFVLWYSLNSLAVFPVHLTIKVFFIYMLHIEQWVIMLTSTLVGTVLIVNFIRNYMPFMLGKFKK